MPLYVCVSGFKRECVCVYVHTQCICSCLSVCARTNLSFILLSVSTFLESEDILAGLDFFKGAA